ncbi:MAG: M23 family metallopeptidase [Gammaproteobacteria bacterium]|nr:M23 family metallopeptidase [Gammaproteobacteria bacterium]
MSMLKYIAVVSLVVIFIGFLLPEGRVIPVKGATSSDWNKDTFWYEPWGTSGVHKGVDIFAVDGTPVIATTNMLTLYKGELSKGGMVVIALGPKWRIHYFAHLSEINQNMALLLQKGEELGKVGDTGNAQGKQPHLHYSIVSLLPLPWLIDGSTQGYKKAFYLNPIEYLR